MQTLIAVTLKSYGTRQLRPDDEFECSDEHAVLLTGLGKARLDSKPAPTLLKPKRGKKGRYNRRDLRAVE